MSIKSKIQPDDIKKIFGNSENKKKFLSMKGLEFKKTFSKIKLDKLIIDNWDYEIDKTIIRKMYFDKNKYLEFNKYEEIKNNLLKYWEEDFGDDISWPFSQGKFDDYIQRVHSSIDVCDFDDKYKMKVIEEQISRDAIKFRRLKQLNLIVNDYIEKMIIESNEEIIPTFTNKKGTDFYIDGESYDQKISKSPTKEFKRDFESEPGGYKAHAKRNPNLVAKYLYELQDEDRFGSNNRLFVVFLDNDKISFELAELKIYLHQFENLKPFEISFKYKHKSLGEKEHKANAYVILI